MTVTQQLTQVNALNFTRAESDQYFDGLLRQTGGINRWSHEREPADVDRQTVIRLNRDTLYSYGIFDVSAGAALTMPETAGRYQTAMVVNQDHYVTHVFGRPGAYQLSVAAVGTPYALVAVRTLVNSADPDDIRAVAALQNQLALTAGSARPFTHPAYDQESLKATREALLTLARGLPDNRHSFGSKERTNPIRHLIGTAAAWGGLPDEQASYLNVEPGLPVGHYTLTIGAVPVRAFWSISVYNRDGYFEKNELGRYNVNSLTAARNPDGTVTVNFGGDPGLPNHLPIMDGWNYMVRLYQPEPAFLDGSWAFPTIEPALQSSLAT